MRELMSQVDVTWVNTIGMRTPRLDLATAQRIAGKLQSALKSRQPLEHNASQHASAEPASPQPNVLNPLMWPWFTRAHDRWLNQSLLLRRLSRELESWSKPRVAITTIPIVADLVGSLPVDRWVYYCVDDFSVWPGLDQATMLRMEHELVAKVDEIVVVSEVLQARIKGLGRDSKLLTHGVDLDKWHLGNVIPYEWPTGVNGPVSLFWGVIDRRLDTEFLLELSQRLKDGSIVFVGPQQEPDPRIAKLENVHLFPAVDAGVLPSMAKAASCLIMPYSDSPVTRAMQPLKLKEYLATGMPVVARNLPATQAWGDACDLVATPKEFAATVLLRQGANLPSVQNVARHRLTHESWRTKATTFLEFLGMMT
jgi:glycosyltransferase involved in cell wall biosynthesis